MSDHLATLKPLFLKPLFYPGNILFDSFHKLIGKTIAFRSFNILEDTNTIYSWVNMPYTLQYWQMNGNSQRITKLYYSILRNSNGHSYMGLLDNQPICQLDVYRVWADEIKQFITAGENDCGFHLLMAPNRQSIPGLTKAVLQTFLEYYFSFPLATRMYAEPDITNTRSNQLLKKTGFHFHHAIEMSYKTANLYSITKEQFYATTPFL